LEDNNICVLKQSTRILIMIIVPISILIVATAITGVIIYIRKKNRIEGKVYENKGIKK